MCCKVRVKLFCIFNCVINICHVHFPEGLCNIFPVNKMKIKVFFFFFFFFFGVWWENLHINCSKIIQLNQLNRFYSRPWRKSSRNQHCCHKYWVERDWNSGSWSWLRWYYLGLLGYDFFLVCIGPPYDGLIGKILLRPQWSTSICKMCQGR